MCHLALCLYPPACLGACGQIAFHLKQQEHHQVKGTGTLLVSKNVLAVARHVTCQLEFKLQLTLTLVSLGDCLR